MKQILIRILSIFVAVGLTLSVLAAYIVLVDHRTVGERILNTIVRVEGSSGIIVYAEENRALVLTAYHTIDDKLRETACSGCIYSFSVSIEEKQYKKPKKITKFEPTYVYFNSTLDIAIIEIKTKHKLEYAKISKYNARVGDEIYLGSNPNQLFRSLKKGIVSSTNRFLGDDEIPAIEVDAGIIYGSSGGGVFTDEGELIGVIRSVRMLRTTDCYLDFVVGRLKCIKYPLPFIGFATPVYITQAFVLSSPFSNDFSYLF